ncbi:MAG: AMIN domain-containing protein [bacterium]
MNKTKLKNLAVIIFCTAFVSLIMFVVPVYAFDGATLSEIKISSKDNYSYKIVLKTDKDVPVEKYITADNKIVIDLKNTRSAEFVNTIYNNSPEIDNVMVQPIANDKVRVFIQGLNISSSKIILDSRTDSLDFMGDNSSAIPANTNNVSALKTEIAEPAQNVQQEEPLPVINLGEKSKTDLKTTAQESVRPQYLENNLQTADNNSPNQENNIETVKNSMIGNASLKKIFSKEGFDWLLRIFAVVFIAIGMFKLLSKPKNVTIELASEKMKTREMDLYRTVAERKELVSRSLGSNYTKEKQVKNHAYGANSQYGIKEYQNSQLPPQRLSRPVDTDINRAVNRKPSTQQLNAALKTTRTVADVRKPVVNNSRISQKEIKTAKTNVDNIKFLENMAAIYQKSGRTDLAQNIRQKIQSTRAAG